MEKHQVNERAISYGWSVDLRAPTLGDVIGRIERGFGVEILERLKEKLNLSVETTAELLGVSPRTLARRRKQGRLDAAESDRLYRVIRLYELAAEVFENEEEARVWFRQPAWALGGKTPLEFAHTEPGAREVEALLERIDYGVLS